MNDFEWMRTALSTLFDSWTDDRVRGLLKNEDERRDFLDSLGSWTAGPALGPGYLDNFLQGVIALRLKFPREEAEAKLELNLTMRGQRR